MKIAMSLALLACLTLTACPQEKSTDTQQNTTTENPSTEAHATPHSEEHKTEDHAEHTSHKVYFVSPTAGEQVKSPDKVQMGIEGMEVKEAGDVVEGTGHHHLIIDGQPIPKDSVVPKDDNHIHFGKGQTETEVELKPGKHTLTLQFADGAHRSYGPDMSNTIEIEVVE